jgi:hypothetical protein
MTVQRVKNDIPRKNRRMHARKEWKNDNPKSRIMTVQERVGKERKGKKKVEECQAKKE